MIEQADLAGSFSFNLPGTSMTVNRMGYGAMQLAGRDGDNLVWVPPGDVDGAIAVLREALASGVFRRRTLRTFEPTDHVFHLSLYNCVDVIETIAV